MRRRLSNLRMVPTNSLGDAELDTGQIGARAEPRFVMAPAALPDNALTTLARVDDAHGQGAEPATVHEFTRYVACH